MRSQPAYRQDMSAQSLDSEIIVRPRLKVCCIANLDEARLAVRYGAAALGLVSAMPSGPGPIEEEQIAAITPHVPPGVATFLLTCQQSAGAIIAQQRRTGANTIQLCDEIPLADYAKLRNAMPGIAIVQVIHVTGPAAVDQAVRVAPHVNALLLDSGNPNLAVKELGGTGRVHDWATSARIVQSAPRPVFLAGGLTSENVGRAIREVRPFGLDLCSGLRTHGKLDEAKLAAFVRAIDEAMALLPPLPTGRGPG
jgi:phosphoribosylanthranilate isomerase